MDNFIATVLAVHCFAWAISWIVLAKWLHANKHDELGKSWAVEIMYSFMLAFVWPASIALMILNDYSKRDNDDRSRS